jgi:hypothetical protein
MTLAGWSGAIGCSAESAAVGGASETVLPQAASSAHAMPNAPTRSVPPKGGSPNMLIANACLRLRHLLPF